MSAINHLKVFIARGNLMDLAVGMIIGTSTTVTS